MQTTTAPRTVTVPLGTWADSFQRYKTTATIELRVGDLTGDLAARGFQTVDHQPAEPGTLTLSITHDTMRAPLGGGRWSEDSGGAGTGRAVAEMIEHGAQWAPGMDEDRARRLAEIADRWHLNTMRAACAHMTPAPVGQIVAVPTPGGWVDLFEVVNYAPSHSAWHHRTNGTEVAEHRDVPTVTCPTCDHTKTHPDWTFGPVYEAVDHYRANAQLRCPVTEYKYGSAWLVEPLPAEILAELDTYGV